MYALSCYIVPHYNALNCNKRCLMWATDLPTLLKILKISIALSLSPRSQDDCILLCILLNKQFESWVLSIWYHRLQLQSVLYLGISRWEYSSHVCILHLRDSVGYWGHWTHRKVLINSFQKLRPTSKRNHDDVIKWKHFLCHWPFVQRFPSHRWIPLTKASDVALWCFLRSVPEQTIE